MLFWGLTRLTAALNMMKISWPEWRPLFSVVEKHHVMRNIHTLRCVFLCILRKPINITCHWKCCSIIALIPNIISVSEARMLKALLFMLLASYTFVLVAGGIEYTRIAQHPENQRLAPFANDPVAWSISTF